jgi:3'-5' exoribonuclease 1
MNHRESYEKCERYVVIDLEATCCDDGSIRRRDTEIIEIGAVLVDASTLQPIDEYQCFVRPKLHPKLTEFCRELTKIRQYDVDKGVTLAEALDGLSLWFADGDALFCSWGDYDNTQFEIEAKRNKLRLPFGGRHLNLKRAFSERRGTEERFGMAGALRVVGLPLVGTHHRGIDDARNIARLLPYCVDVGSAVTSVEESPR